MRIARPYSADLQQQLSTRYHELHTAQELRRYQCVWLQLSLGLSAAAIGQALHLHPVSVKTIQAQFRNRGFDSILGEQRGGRRHQNLSVLQEDALLKPFLNKAEAGGMLVIHELKAAYERRVGHPVPKSTVYRMLERHGWRKIAPRPRHPKANREAQMEFKKTSRN